MFELRPYQHEAVTAILKDLETIKSVIAVLPTGSGKTEIFAEIAKRLVNANNETGILILSHLSLLTEQTEARLKLRAPTLQVDVMQGERKPKWNSSVVISTMQTSRNEDHIDALAEKTMRKIDVIIVDEAHMIPTPSYQQILTYFPNAKVIGFTATPFRDRQIMTSYFEKVSYSISLQNLIDQGYLVPPKLHEIISKGDSVADVMGTVVHLFKTQAADRQAIVYMQTIDDTRTLRSAFEEAGVSAHAVTQELVGDYRTQILSDFNQGKTQVLTTVNVLTAGFDSPRVGAIFMPYGTSSPTTYLQRIGRGLRPLPGKSDCLVYVFGDAPSVSKKVYEQLTRRILQAGGPPRNQGSFKDDLLFNDYTGHGETLIWNSSVVAAITRMEKLGMMQFAKLLNEKAFPQRFMQNIATLLASLPGKKTSLPGGQKPATEAQKSVLFRAGFASDALKAITKGEASMMIGTVFNQENRRSPQQERFRVPEGTHAGKHVAELPHAYRALVKKRFPDSPVAKVITEWEQERKRA